MPIAEPGAGSDRMPALNVCVGGFSFDEIDIPRLSEVMLLN
jgi:hypothetical protein